MSLEAALAENTAALKEVAALLAESNAGRAEALNAVKAAATGGATSTPRGRKPKGQAEETPSEETSAPTKTFTSQEVSDRAQKYLAVDSKEERDARLAKVREAVAGLKTGKGKKIVDIDDQDDLATLDAALAELEAAGDLVQPEEDDEV